MVCVPLREHGCWHLSAAVRKKKKVDKSRGFEVLFPFPEDFFVYINILNNQLYVIVQENYRACILECSSLFRFQM